MQWIVSDSPYDAPPNIQSGVVSSDMEKRREAHTEFSPLAAVTYLGSQRLLRLLLWLLAPPFPLTLPTPQAAALHLSPSALGTSYAVR